MSEPAPPEGVLLCADDFAMTNGVSQSIVELAEAGRLSAVSAFTTTAHWPSHATWIARMRGKVAVGLHFNLTLGSPLAAMPNLAPGATFPTINQLTARSLRGAINLHEIAAEVTRQLAAFEAEIGFPPDHIDGHQHVHALPGIRRAVLDAAGTRYSNSRLKPLMRSPCDSLVRIAARGRNGAKAAILAALTTGFTTAARRAGFPVNDSFGGVTGFADTAVEADYAAAVEARSGRHLVMCHPGEFDAELERIDPILGRRVAEHRYLLSGGFQAPLWRPRRTAMGKPVDWQAEWTPGP